MAAKKSKSRKALPTWLSIVIIVGVIAGIAVVYYLKPGSTKNWKDDPDAIALIQKFDKDIQNYDFFKKRSPALQKQLVDEGRVPPEWLEGNPVPYYKPKDKKNTETPAPAN